MLVISTALTLNYVAISWLDQSLVPVCIDDQPLPLAQTQTLPRPAGGVYPAGSVFTLVFANLGREDLTRIAQLVGTITTFTIMDQIIGWVRGPATATWDAATTTLVVTYTAAVKVGLTEGVLGYF